MKKKWWTRFDRGIEVLLAVSLFMTQTAVPAFPVAAETSIITEQIEEVQINEGISASGEDDTLIVEPSGDQTDIIVDGDVPEGGDDLVISEVEEILIEPDNAEPETVFETETADSEVPDLSGADLMVESMEEMTYALGLEDRAGSIEEHPVNFYYSYINGGTVVTDVNGNPVRNQALLGHGEHNAVTLDLTASSQLGSGEGRGMFFEMDLPYLYYDDNGALRITHNVLDVPSDQLPENNPNAMYVGARISPPEGWEEDIDSDTVYYGKNRFHASDISITDAKSITLRAQIFLVGKIPENTEMTIWLGGGYDVYVDANGKEGNDYYFEPGAKDEYIYHLICSNLQWNPAIKAVTPKNVKWDRYNYLVYKATVENTSTDDASHIKEVDPLSVKLPSCEDDSTGWGVRTEDIMRWRYNPDGEPTENTDYSDLAKEESYIGIPGNGGALIYDVTGISDETLAKLDLSSFDNIVNDEGQKLEPLPYHFTSDCRVSFPTGEHAIHMNEKLEYYFAIPLGTDTQETIISAQLLANVKFGANYGWTKFATDLTNGFVPPEIGATHNHYLLDGDGNKIREKTVAIGSKVDHHLSGFGNTSNVPVFNFSATEALDEHFIYDGVSILMNHEEDESVALTDWLRENGTAEFEFTITDAQGKKTTKFVPLGAFSPDADRTTSTCTAWSMDAQPVKDYIAANTSKTQSCTFTNRVRIRFKDRISANTAFDGEIIVTGLANESRTYTNNLGTYYENWTWLPNEEDYLKTGHDLPTIPVKIVAAAATPTVVTDVFHNEDGKLVYNDPLSVPVNTPGVGFRYRLYNDSISTLIPGVFKSGDLAKGTIDEPEGLIVEHVVLSAKLLADSIPESITFQTLFGEKVVIDGDEFAALLAGAMAASQDLVFSSELWEEYGALHDFKVVFKSFSENTKLDADRCIKVDGQVNVVKTQKPVGVFSTDYENPDLNRESKDEAVMNVTSIQPVLTGYSYQDDTKSAINTANSTQAQQKVNSLTVPNKQEHTGYEFELTNKAVASV